MKQSPPISILPTWLTPYGLSLGVVGGLLAIAVGAYFGADRAYAGKILPGVSVLGIELGGETVNSAKFVVNKSLSLGKVQTVSLTADDNEWEINPVDYGFKADANALVQEAFRVGRTGRLAQDFNARVKALSGQPQVATIESSQAYSFDQDKLVDFLKSDIVLEIEQEVQEAKLVVAGHCASTFQPDQTGRTLDINASVNQIVTGLLNPDAKVELAVERVEPKKTLAQTNDLGIDTLIGRGESSFAGSPKNRRHNIAVGAGRFDGLVFKPGETISFMKELGPVDASAGFLPELVIKEDKTTPEFGGGLCQVSTTTFRAALNGGLTVNERRNHSYRVQYYEPAGTDATVYDPYPDFKFTNDTPGHLLIDTYIVGDKLFFDFYGTQTNRKVEMDGPHISNVTALPDPIYIDTSTLPPGETKQVEVAHRGASAVLYRKVYDDSGKIIHNDTFKSTYIPWPAKFLRGVEDAQAVQTNLGNIAPGPEATDEDPPVDDSNN